MICIKPVLPGSSKNAVRWRTTKASGMKPALISIAVAATALILTAAPALAIQCAKGVYRAGCAGPNGVVVAGPRGAAAVRTNQVRPGTSVTGARGNTATKAIALGCAFVNGQRICR